MTDRLILTRLLNATEKSKHIISLTKQLSLGLLVRGLPMWISYSLWISIFRQTRFRDIAYFPKVKEDARQ